MAIVLAVDGRKRIINAFLRNLNTNITFKYHLFKNNYTPTDAMVIGDFTESNFTGYATSNVASAAWGSPTDDGTCSTTSGGNVTFTTTGTGAQSAYGYYVTDNADGVLLFAERFDTPIDMSPSGATITLPVKFQERMGTPC